MTGSKKFNSNDFLFRETSMGSALRAAGLGKPTLVREEKIHALVRARSDKNDSMPSIAVHIIPAHEPARKREQKAA